MRHLATLLLALIVAAPTFAVIIDSVDGAGNNTAPVDDPGTAFVEDDPGWDHMGVAFGNTAVYLGNGWAIAADHVVSGGAVDVRLFGINYPAIPGSKVQLTNPGGVPSGSPDIAVWQIDTAPVGLAELTLGILPLRSESLLFGDPAMLIGAGKARLPALINQSCPPGPAKQGYQWDPVSGNRRMRWGTNTIDQVDQDLSLGGRTSRVFTTVFDQGISDHESQVATSDSGGGTFARNGAGDWELAGILVGGEQFGCQAANPETSLYGNASLIVEVAYYRDEIVTLTRPECSDEIDNDFDGLLDLDDPGCQVLEGLSEGSDCDDGFDNDGDGLIDYPADPGCRSTNEGHFEDPQCDDDLDNDGNGLIDFDGAGGSPDPNCSTAWDTIEKQVNQGNGGCGLLGIEALLLWPWLGRLRRSRPRA